MSVETWVPVCGYEGLYEVSNRGVVRQVDIGDLFFPDKGGSTKEAKAVCAQCPVVDQCLEYALAHQERFGIWGGYSERERRRMLKGVA